MTEAVLTNVLAELAALEDPKMRSINERHGDDHGVNLSKMRALAKSLKTQPELARELWSAQDTAAQLLAILVSRPRDYSEAELDVMLRQARSPKVHEWFVNYIVKKSPHAEALRQKWFDDPDPLVDKAGWDLTSERTAKRPEGIDRVALLDQIETQMKGAPDRLQWAMNQCLAQIGIYNPDLRERAIDIGERLEVLKDYPMPPGCTSPFAPIWIKEIVRRKEGVGLRKGFEL